MNEVMVPNVMFFMGIALLPLYMFVQLQLRIFIRNGEKYFNAFGNITTEFSSIWGIQKDFYSDLSESGLSKGAHLCHINLCVKKQQISHWLYDGSLENSVYMFLWRCDPCQCRPVTKSNHLINIPFTLAGGDGEAICFEMV